MSKHVTYLPPCVQGKPEDYDFDEEPKSPVPVRPSTADLIKQLQHPERGLLKDKN